MGSNHLLRVRDRVQAQENQLRDQHHDLGHRLDQALVLFL